MSNILDNGTVLPSGLLSKQGTENAILAFNRSYRNTGLKVGIVIKSYAPEDPANQNGLCSEVDVMTIEQFENKGSTSIVYRNCILSQGFGSIADYFEYTLRPKTFQNNEGTPTFSNQDGAIAIIQCLDGIGDKAAVVGNLIHPDRPTNIVGTDPQLFFAYNGIESSISPDGSFDLVFNGATDSEGNVVDENQGTTTLQIEQDGSFQIDNSEIVIRLDKTNKEITISSTGNFTINIQGDTNITTTGETNITSSGNTTVEGAKVLLGENASESVILGDTFKKLFDAHIHPTVVGPSGPPSQPLLPAALSRKVKTE